MQLLLGFIFAIIISLLAYKVKSLDKSGALAATVEGTLIFGLGGWAWAILLLTFFVSSSALSKMFKKHKVNLQEKFDKGSRRDAMQVLGNGGLAALFVTGWIAGLYFYRWEKQRALAFIVWASSTLTGILFLVAVLFAITTTV